jgi:hypothetical protein
MQLGVTEHFLGGSVLTRILATAADTSKVFDIVTRDMKKSRRVSS